MGTVMRNLKSAIALLCAVGFADPASATTVFSGGARAKVDETFTIGISVFDLTEDLGAFDIGMDFDPIIEVVGVDFTDLLDPTIQEDWGAGGTSVSFSLTSMEYAFPSDPPIPFNHPPAFTLATIAFRALTRGRTLLAFDESFSQLLSLRDGGPLLDVNFRGSVVRVGPIIPEPSDALCFGAGLMIAGAAGGRRNRA